MTKVIAISGSLRKGSFNTALLRAAKMCTPDDVGMEITSIHNIPVYNFDDEEKNGIPTVVAELKEKIATCDGLLISTPEYNHSIPGVIKNAIDWCTRPTSDVPRLFHNRKVGLIGTAPSRLGTAFSQTAWLPVLRYLNTHTYFAKQLFISGANTVFDDQGNLIDANIQQLLQEYIDGFIDFVKGKDLPCPKR